MFDVLEPAIDPNNRITFLLDWELTMKCNLDCSYCGKDLYGGHDNTTDHPEFDQCLQTIDFMFAYADLYMKIKPRALKYVVLNVYGGEALHYPKIDEILNEVRLRHKPYAQNWHLTVTTTTNAIVSKKKLLKIIPFIDEFTVSYHAENDLKKKQQFRDNLLTIAQSGKRQKCIVLMHDNLDLFEDCQNQIKWLIDNDIKYLSRPLDGDVGATEEKRIYKSSQIKWFGKVNNEKSFASTYTPLHTDDDQPLFGVGRSCCGGRQLCSDQDYKQRHFFVGNKFPDWYCSVNHFFLYVKQINGEIFVNKDCKMRFDGQIGPIGNLDHCDKLLNQLEHQLDTNTLPVIQCKKNQCQCGLCAPKAKELETYQKIMQKYQSKSPL